MIVLCDNPKEKIMFKRTTKIVIILLGLLLCSNCSRRLRAPLKSDGDRLLIAYYIDFPDSSLDQSIPYINERIPNLRGFYHSDLQRKFYDKNFTVKELKKPEYNTLNNHDLYLLLEVIFYSPGSSVKRKFINKYAGGALLSVKATVYKKDKIVFEETIKTFSRKNEERVIIRANKKLIRHILKEVL